MVNIPLYVTYTKASGILKEFIDMRLSPFWPNISFQLDLLTYTSSSPTELFPITFTKQLP